MDHDISLGIETAADLLIFLALVLIVMPGHAWMDVDDSHSKFDWRVMPRSPGKTTAPGLPMQAELELQCS